MRFKDLFKLIALVLVIVFLALACASSEPKSDFELDVNDNEITVAVSEAVARGLMEDLIGADLECDGEVDGHLRALLEKLDRDGPRARASYRDSQDTVSPRRRGGVDQGQGEQSRRPEFLVQNEMNETAVGRIRYSNR